MSGFDGNGNFVRSYSWTNDAANSIDITASRFDTEHDGFATALSNCVTRDSQGKMGADFLPVADASWSLGSLVARWKNAFFKGKVQLDAPASGDCLVANGTSTFNAGVTVNAPIVSTSQVTAIGTSIGAVKPADTARNSTITLTDDPDLHNIPLVPGTYAYEAFLKPHNVSTAGNGFSFKLNFTGSCSGQFAGSGIINTVAGDLDIVFSNYNSTVNLPNVTAAVNFDYLHLTGFIVVGTLGNMSLQWAQRSSSANNTILDQGSWIRFSRIV